uniref:Uncharacterized protein n=1 Tax=Uncultured marine euryarchaeote TaxID=257466 RepID=A0A1B0Z1W9_UNCAR|nr:hypothetical protein [uncultured marine euryarchaeote]
MATPMSMRVGSPAAPAQGRHGLSWAAFANRWMLILIAVLILFGMIQLDLLERLSRIPIYYLIGMAGGLGGLPFLIGLERSKQIQLVAYPESGKMTIWRVGKRVGLHLSGNPVHLTSDSGISRLFVKSFDTETHEVESSWVADCTSLDWLRDETTFIRLANNHSDLIHADRITKELVGCEVARRVGELSDQWLRLMYGSLSVDEIEEALGMVHGAEIDIEPDADLVEVLGDE